MPIDAANLARQPPVAGPRVQLRIGAAALGFAVAGSALAAQPADRDDRWTYIVQPGDNPWSITRRHLDGPRRVPDLVRLNRIAEPRQIPPGTALQIPYAWMALRPAEVRVLALEGEVEVQTAGGEARPALVGERLATGTQLRTGAMGSVRIGMDDGSRVLIRPETVIKLGQTQRPAAAASSAPGRIVRFELLRGAIENLVQPQGTGGRYEIRTPAAVAAVRGTEFRVEAGAERLRAEVVGGAVAVRNAQGRTALAAGQGAEARLGQAPEPARPLLPAPDLAAVPDVIERLPIDLPLPAVDRAAAYRTQFAAAAADAALAADDAASAPRIRARDVPDGRYELRVRAIDATGLEGLDARRALTVHARPEPPLLIAPPPDAVIADARPSFRWAQPSVPGRGARLQLADSEDFAAPLLDREISDGSSAQPETDLAPGVYHWRLAATDPALGLGPWGDVQHFRRVLPGPGAEPPTVGDDSAVLRWAAQPGAVRYKLQIAGDADFAGPLLVDTEVDTAQFTLARPPAGSYYVRVQARFADGVDGLWGTTQRFEVPDRPKRWWLLLLPLLILAW